MRKTTLVAIAAGLVLALGSALPAEAGTITLRDDLDDSINFRKSNGGEFRMTFTGSGPWFPTAPAPAGVHDFGTFYSGGVQTFCVERDEAVALNTAYDYTLDTFIKHQSGNRALAAGTAYLYTQFWFGTLGQGTSAAYQYDETLTGAGNREDSGRALQLAIWKLQGFSNDDTEYNANTLAQAYVSLANNAVAGSWGSSLGNVRVVNLYSGELRKQSQLVLVPLPPAALAGLGMLGGLALLRLQRRRRSI